MVENSAVDRRGGRAKTAAVDHDETRAEGRTPAGSSGRGHDQDIGDGPGEMPPAATEPGGTTVQVVAGANNTCARDAEGVVRCRGAGSEGQLGDGGTTDVGGDPPTFPPATVDLGGAADLLAADAEDSTCARLADGSLRCWGLGANESGQLGLGFARTGPFMTTPAAAGRVMF